MPLTFDRKRSKAQQTGHHGHYLCTRISRFFHPSLSSSFWRSVKASFCSYSLGDSGTHLQMRKCVKLLFICSHERDSASMCDPFTRISYFQLFADADADESNPNRCIVFRMLRKTGQMRRRHAYLAFGTCYLLRYDARKATKVTH